MTKKESPYQRKCVVSIEEIFPLIDIDGKKKKKKDCNASFSGIKVNTSSLRLQLFKSKGTSCVCCGVNGTFLQSKEIIVIKTKLQDGI